MVSLGDLEVDLGGPNAGRTTFLMAKRLLDRRGGWDDVDVWEDGRSGFC